MKQNNGDSKKTAANIQTMQKAGANLNLQVRTPESMPVFEHLAGNKTSPWRFLLAWLLKPQGMIAGFGVIAYGILAAMRMF
ncbi:MAG: hypothetical protein KDE46_00310 [Caldilineaceae bacterium]|nr:hypothetical protein [Caldilineaceae bacterium]